MLVGATLLSSYEIDLKNSACLSAPPSDIICQNEQECVLHEYTKGERLLKYMLCKKQVLSRTPTSTTLVLVDILHTAVEHDRTLQLLQMEALY